MQNNVLAVSGELEWYNWFNEEDGGCSGIRGGCDHCTKRMYQKRSTYLTGWLTTFITNVEAIRLNRATMPVFQWYAMPTAKRHDTNTFHSNNCPCLVMLRQQLMHFLPREIITYIGSFLTLKECVCDLALLLNALDIRKSLDQIYPRYKRIARATRVTAKCLTNKPSI
jgi:hypothetical protein